MGQGLTAVFYLPHLIADEIGFFRDEGLTIDFVTSFNQQWSMLENGKVDFAIGGPNRALALEIRKGKDKRIVNFCAAIQGNPWYLIGRRAEPAFTWSSLLGKTVISYSDAPTPAACFRWLLEQHGIGPNEVRMVGGMGTERELATFRAGEGDYLLHSLYTAAPLINSGDAVAVQELATPTGRVPWSTYATTPSMLLSRETELEAFTRAIARALAWVSTHSAEVVAAALSRHFPDLSHDQLAGMIGAYQLVKLWPDGPVIPRTSYEHYCAILVATGELPYSLPFEDQVDIKIAQRATAALFG